MNLNSGSVEILLRSAAVGTQYISQGEVAITDTFEGIPYRELGKSEAKPSFGFQIDDMFVAFRIIYCVFE